MKAKTYYELLDVAENASVEVIQESLKRQRQEIEVLMRFPVGSKERTMGEAQTALLDEAGKVLLDPEARPRYDESLHTFAPVTTSKSEKDEVAGLAATQLPHHRLGATQHPAEPYSGRAYVKQWWFPPVIIILVLALPTLVQIRAVFAKPATPNTKVEPPFLQVGLYEWPSFAPHFAAKAMNIPNPQTNLTPVGDLSLLVPQPNQPVSYDVIGMPLAALVENYDLLDKSKWKILWVPEESAGLDRILVNKQVSEGASVLSGDAITIRGTSAAHLLDLYIDSIVNNDQQQKQAYYDRHLKADSLTPWAVFQRAANDIEKPMVVAIHEPWATKIETVGFQDDSARINKHFRQHHVNLLLVKNSLFVSKRDLPVLFIANLFNYPGLLQSDSTAVKERDPTIVDDFGFSKLQLPDPEFNLHRLIRAYRMLDLKQNIEFLYGFGPFNCQLLIEDIAQTSIHNEHLSLCTEMIDDKQLDTLIDKLQKTNKIEVSQFDDHEIKEMCSSKAVQPHADKVEGFVLGNANIGRTAENFRPIENQIKELVGSQLINRGFSYCLVGHGDEEGDDRTNEDIGRRRAKAVADELAKNYAFDPHRFAITSMGKQQLIDDYNPGKNRRVEIKQLRFAIEQK